jgi:hypothetical protein
MVKRKISILFIIFHLFFIPAYLEAWNETRTHPDLSEMAARKSILGNQNYLMNIGFSKGIDEKINGKEIFKWIRDGAELEDKSSTFFPVFGTTRSLNHFHNPLKAWAQAGLDDWYINHYTGESSLLWAQDGNKQQSVIKGDWSWQKTRQYYYLALTSPSDLLRQENFAKTFRGLGHQMHLLQDTAVPDHVRNDAHPEDAIFGKDRLLNSFYFETWAKRQSNFINALASNPIFSNVSFDVSRSKDAPAPITQLYDSDQYNGANPSNSLTQGLSEYTNANFFSNDTIFAAEEYSTDHRHYFPYPKRSSTDLQSYIDQNKLPETVTSEDGVADTSFWIRKTADGEKNINHFVRPSYFTVNLLGSGGESMYYRTFYRDEKCHEDYAKLLIPRAVGYSAGLLNYFFRGDIKLEYVTSPEPGYVIINNTGEEMDGDFTIYYDNLNDERNPLWTGKGTLEATKGDKTNSFNFITPNDAKEPGRYIVVFKGKMGNEDGAMAGYVSQRLLKITPPDQFVYSMVDADQPDPYFTSIKAKVKNASTSEAMQNGVIQAVAKYKTGINDVDYIYSMSAPRSITSLAPDQTTEFEFNFSNDPIPVDVTDLYLQVIFKGTIGNENNAVALGLKDISEPTPIDVFNNMDRVCLYGSWYAAGSEDAIKTAGQNSDVYAHDVKDIYIKLSPSDTQNASPTNYDFYVESLPAGQFKRVLYVLADFKFSYSFYNKWTPVAGEQDPWAHIDETFTYQGTAVKNQTDITSDPQLCGNEIPCPYTTTSLDYFYRGSEMWWGGGLIYVNRAYPEGSSCQ